MPFALSCTVCTKPLTFFENLTNRQTLRCNACEARLRAFQEDTLAWIERAFHEQAGVTAEIEEEIYLQITVLRIPAEIEAPILSRLGYVRNLTRIRHGDFPHVRTDIAIDTDEYAHFELQATHVKPSKSRIKKVPGRLIGTNKKVYFVPDTGQAGATLSWNNILQTKETTLHITEDGYTTACQVLRIMVAKGSGGGDYEVPDILYARTIIDALGRRWRRYLVEKHITDGVVPDHIKAQVHLRDGGLCVQCGYHDPYIEYDHKIPRSKGGLHTVDNIQLLCRGCNRKKGAKIDAAFLEHP